MKAVRGNTINKSYIRSQVGTSLAHSIEDIGSFCTIRHLLSMAEIDFTVSSTEESSRDVWIGAQDARQRKKIQDRLAQRARSKSGWFEIH